MTEPGGLVVINSISKPVRVLLILTGLGLAVSAACGGLLLFGVYDLSSGSNAATACLTGLVAGGAITLSMLIAALAATWSARATDRALARLLADETLADWRFAPQEWDRFVEAEEVRLSRGWWTLWVVLGLPVMLALGIPAWVLADSGIARARNLILAALAAGLLGGIAAFLRARFIRRRVAQIRRIPRVLIGMNAVYCAGIFRPWNIMTTVLRRIRVIPGPPMMLDIVIGPGQSTQTALRLTRGALTVAAAFGGVGGAGISESSFISTLQVPVPAGKEEEAARVVDAVLHAPAPGTAPDVSTPSSLDAAASRPTGGSGRWWRLTFGLLGAGLGAFLLAPSVAPPTSDQAGNPALYTAIGVVGLLLWVAAGVTALVAIVKHARAWLSRPKAAPR